VREWLKELAPGDRKVIGFDIKTVEYGWPIGMPVCRAIVSHKGLWEVRSHLPGGRIARMLFCIEASRLVLLHGFIKKSQQTPKPDLDLAAKRMKEVRHE
jgi:phage-related protein